MQISFQRHRLHPFQELGEVRVAGKITAQREHVDEESDQPLELRQIAIGDRRPDDQVGLPGHPADQRLKRRQKGHEKGRAVLISEPQQGVGGRPVEGDRQAGTAKILNARPRPVSRQVDRRRGAFETMPPMIQQLLEDASAQPLALPGDEIAVLHRRFRQR